MFQQTIRKLWPAALVAALVLAGCDGSSTRSENTTSQVESPAAKAATGTVSLAVQFPQHALKKALIDQRTTKIRVEWRDYHSFALIDSRDLVPDGTGLATTTLEVPVGAVEFVASAYETVPDPYYPQNTMDKELERVASAGMIVEGANTVYLTFLSGDWQFVDAGDNPLPLQFQSSQGTRTLAGFSLQGEFYDPYGYGMSAGKAAVDWYKPVGWSDYYLTWYAPAAGGGFVSVGPGLNGEQMAQFLDGTTTNSSIYADWLNLDEPNRSEIDDHQYDIEPAPGDRVAFILDSVSSSDGNFSMKDGNGQDLLPTFNQLADSRVVDGTHLAGHMIEMTLESFDETVVETNVDCQLFWSSLSSPAAARSAAVRTALAAAGPRKAAPGDEQILVAGTMTIESDFCEQYPQYIDVDGDGDYMNEFLINDVNGNGAYDPADGDTFDDWDNDGVFDRTIPSDTQVDGDGDGDMMNEYLTFDANKNWRFDDGDTYTDSDGDGHFDYTFYPGDIIHETETFSDVRAREFRARGQQGGTLFPPMNATLTGTWVMGSGAVGDMVALTFVDGEYFLLAEDGTADESGFPGMEGGGYVWNPWTGTFDTRVWRDTNGEWGFSHPFPSGVADIVSVNGDVLTFTTVESDGTNTYTFNRVIPSGIVGSWKAEEFDETNVVTFFANGTYLFVKDVEYDAFDSGIERGTYTWDGTSASLTATLKTLQGESGIAPVGETVTLPLSVDGDVATVDDPVDGPFTLARVK